MKPNDFSDARVLVTGGAGFIGSALVWALNRRGCDNIVVCDILGTDEKWRNLTPLRFADYVEADDLLPRLQSGALGKFDLVLHMGACSATTERDADLSHPQQFRIHQGPRRTGRWRTRCASFMRRPPRPTATARRAWRTMMPSSTRLRPLNMYGYSKHLFDLHAKRAGFLNKMVGLKFFNVFGPNEDHKGDMRSLVHKSFAQVRERASSVCSKAIARNTRTANRSAIFFTSRTRGHDALHLAANEKAGGLFNIGSGQARTWIDLARAVFAALKKAENRIHRDAEAIRDKYQYFTQANLLRLRAAGYAAPVTSLENAVQ
jgi:ADP-L-glycero-D-manno-heptose 6-epimerase